MAEENKTNKNTDVSHAGHRGRIMEEAYKNGLENLSRIKAVEVFLTFILPRVDVNPLAHRLLETFGNLPCILQADINELISIKGLNKASAQKIKVFHALFEYNNINMAAKKICIDDSAQLFDLLEKLTFYKQSEHLFLFALDHSLNIIGRRVYSVERVRSVGIEPMEIYNFIASTKMAAMLAVHNHPGGSAMPSKDDFDAKKYTEYLLAPFDIPLVNSLIIGEDGIYSHSQQQFIKTFTPNYDIDFLDFDQK